MASVTQEPEILPELQGRIPTLGRKTILALRGGGRGTLMFLRAVTSLRYLLTRRSRRETLHQMFVAGIKSLGVVTVVAAFTGMILALQTGLELRKFAQEVNIGTAVMVSMLREMGPFMTALILAASVGSSIAAQMGTMTVAEEIAALEVMSIDPVRFLMMPRLVGFWAGRIACPAPEGAPDGSVGRTEPSSKPENPAVPSHVIIPHIPSRPFSSAVIANHGVCWISVTPSARRSCARTLPSSVSPRTNEGISRESSCRRRPLCANPTTRREIFRANRAGSVW